MNYEFGFGGGFGVIQDTMEGRLLEAFSYAIGADVQGYLDDPNVMEIMLNPDGKLWVDSFGKGCEDTKIFINPIKAEQVIRLVATHTGEECDEDHPILSAELPGNGSRFQGMLPKVVAAPTFAIRKKATRIFTLDDYVLHNMMTERYKEIIVQAVWDKLNILVVGGTGSGKTTLCNAILQEISKMGGRIILIEDTLELQCTAENKVPMRTRPGSTMSDLVKSSLRMRPDWIIVGEVRGAEALDLCSSWTTGHSGLGTLHSNSAKGGLSKLQQYISRVVVTPQKELIGEAVDMVVFIERYGNGRRVKEILRVHEFDGEKYVTEDVV